MDIFKFGGASVKDADGVKNLANIVRDYKKGNLLIVISAMGKITDKLEKLTQAFLSQSDEAHAIFDEIKHFHFSIIDELFQGKANPVYDDVANTFVEIDWLIEDEPDNNPDYIYDQIVSIGEVVSTKIVAAWLNETGNKALWIDARNYIQTDNTYREGKVDWAKTNQIIQKDLLPLLTDNIIVTQGFIGGTSENYTTTLGREGSDYSAAIFASCLDAAALTIWKDVPGVLNADPKWFDETEKIAQLSYHDAIELTYYGATVIHPKTIKPLQNKGIPLFVRSFIQPEGSGTAITKENNPLPIPSFIFKVNQALISIFPKDYSFIIEENLSNIFELFHTHRIKINTMLNSAISFSVSVDDHPTQIEKLIKDLSQEFTVRYNKGLELVTIRYYNQQTIDRVTVDKDILLEVKSRHTCQMVMKNRTV
ncbi:MULTISPECIES: aspartate kinase [unclassified Pedobacter]|uniref:aspartate kinase n=1 Tax=unclassified Pedobacter TaxID=2628915 RepID=UPI001DB9BBCB|nr:MULTISPECIES: aspartate kinase [unclassified Pedobacter]CAH0178419.1 Lysine-sensitive aspartokinase 3 [Pedobacter sp. Bi126]